MHRLNTIANFIYPALESFIKSTGYRNKEATYNNAIGQIQQFVDEISNGPTKLSYEAMIPLMNKLRVLLKQAYDEVVVLSEPKVTLTLLSKETVINDDGTVSLQISVSNHRDSSPIKEVSVVVQNDTGVQFLPNSANMHYNAIEGGESSILKVSIKVSDEVINNMATAINIICKYKSGANIREMTSQVTLKLYTQEDYKPINNPYAPVADGGPVPINSTMFFGREEFIANIVNAITNAPSKQIIIYGQKRCGKSSVMLHLKNKLETTGNNLCVFFSLGDIIQNLTEEAFYHKILTSIADELDDIEFNGGTIPDIKFPNALNFKEEDPDNPLNTFAKYMRLFKRACKMTKGWEDKNLVVMIDEFTYLYTEIKKGHIAPSIMKQWKAVTQNEKAQFSVVLVGQDVVPSFKKEDYARNAFGVIEDIRLTYLQEEPARELIEKPILDENGESRYIGNAVSRIIEYTSRNPYYIQIFCARLVDYMNRNKSIKVTEADVNDVAKSFFVGEQALDEDKFDNLIRAGETEDLQEYPESEILAILRQIAIGAKNIGYCCIDDINILGDKDREREIIKHLIDREVLEQKGKNNYRIQVKLFQEWLLNH
jgi:AAA+ ATPase superfamily predicted ATPase